jgi:hypothetical protein
MKNRLKLLILMAFICTGIISCGGGSGAGGGNLTVSTTLGGKVIDGYISGATVCLDLNSNNQCDLGEPSTQSGSDGSYTLNYSGSVVGLQIVSVVPKGAVDSDLGVINIPYNLLAPVPTDSSTYKDTHVTPLTTLVATTISQAGGQTALTPKEANDKLVATLGLPTSTSLSSDYKANSNSSLGQVATFTAAAIAQVSNNLSGNTAIAAQLTPGQITQAAVQQVQAAILPNVMSNGALNSTTSAAVTTAVASKDSTALMNSSGVVTNAVTNAGLSTSAISSATTGGTITGSVLNIVNGTKNSSTSTVVNLQNIFKTVGFVIAQLNNYVHFINSSGTVSCLDNKSNPILFFTAYGANNNCGSETALKAEFIQFDITDPNNNTGVTFNLVGNKWFTDYETGQGISYDGSSWVPKNNNIAPTFTNNCISLFQNSGISQQVCAVQIDMSGKLMSNYIPDLCVKSSTSSPSANCSTATFPPGSYGYDLTLTVQSSIKDTTYNGNFQIYTDKTWRGYCTDKTTNNCTNPNSTLTDFINYTKTNMQFMGSACNTPFMITSYDSVSKTGVISFGSNTAGACTYNTFKSVETQNFSVITKGGKDLMIFPNPSTYKTNNPGNTEPYKIFGKGCLGSSTTNCGIYQGDYLPVNFSQSIPFNGNIRSNGQFVNPTLFDAVMAIQGQTAFPYKKSGSSGTPVTSGENAPIF